MRVKYKNRAGNIRIVESLAVFPVLNGIEIQFLYVATNISSVKNSETLYPAKLRFYLSNAEELLEKAFESGFLDLTDAEQMEK